ncbi:hypothetical protein [Streptomyces sp. NPDC047928]|uniref:hypothetical protein n=1 Tax=unclassified Streptomyces TaxID=2593676 RepID=UPI0037183538
MDDKPAGPALPEPGLSTQPVHPTSAERGSPFVAFVGKEFAAALHEGLRRARTTQRGGGREPVRRPAPPRPVTRGGALLGEYAGVIARRFEQTLPTAPALAGDGRGRVRRLLVGWARHVLTVAQGVGRPGERVAVPFPEPAAHQHAVAVSLLIEAVVVCLPPGAPEGQDAIRAVAYAARQGGATAPPGRRPPAPAPEARERARRTAARPRTG